MEFEKIAFQFQRGWYIILVKKLKIFHGFIFRKIDKENVFDEILHRKKAFLDIKKINFKNSKKLHFSKGVSPWFSSKIWDFSFFYFWKSRREKCVWRYSQSKNSLFRLKKTLILKTRNKCIFPKGLVHGFGQKIDFFSIFSFLGKISKANLFGDVLESKKSVSRQ